MRLAVPLELLQKAVDARARGRSWETIAVETHRSARTCRSWPVLYAAEWNRLYRDALFRQLNDAAGQASIIVTSLVRNDNPWVAFAASNLLLKPAISEWVRANFAAADAGAVDAEVQRAVEHVKGLTNAQLNTLVQQVVARRPLPVDASDHHVGDDAASRPANGA
jgi:hypothetical protein